MLQNIIQFFSAKKKYQSFFSNLYYISLQGMNYYNVVSPKQSGEKELVKNIVLEKPEGENFILLDIGAHRGEYIELFVDLNINLKHLSIHAFEPQLECANCIKNRYEHKVHELIVNQCAVGNQKEDIDLFISEENDLIATTFLFPIKSFIRNLSGNFKIQNVKKINLKDYIKQTNITSIDLIKIDTEGDEYEILETLVEFYIEKKIIAIQFEYCFINMYKKNMFFDFWTLLSPYYNFYRVLINGIEEIESYHITYEQSAPINYYLTIK